jgi:hypothetical protein
VSVIPPVLDTGENRNPEPKRRNLDSGFRFRRNDELSLADFVMIFRARWAGPLSAFPAIPVFHHFVIPAASAGLC